MTNRTRRLLTALGAVYCASILLSAFGDYEWTRLMFWAWLIASGLVAALWWYLEPPAAAEEVKRCALCGCELPTDRNSPPPPAEVKRPP